MQNPGHYTINSPQIVEEVIDGEVILINLETGTYYSLVGSGAVVWRVLRQSGESDVIASARQCFENVSEHFENDVAEFIAELESEQLILKQLQEGDSQKISFSFSQERMIYTKPVLEKFTDMQELLLIDPIHDVGEQGWPLLADGSTESK